MPKNKINIKKEDGITFIFCLVRKKWIQLTPEEKVRQFLVHYLSDTMLYPISFISVEKQIKVNQLQKRYDIVVYNTELKPFILIECKANHINLNETTMQQLLNYNIQLKAPYLMISNGSQHHIFELQADAFVKKERLPNKNEIFYTI
jgi:hypothetical protein